MKNIFNKIPKNGIDVKDIENALEENAYYDSIDYEEFFIKTAFGIYPEFFVDTFNEEEFINWKFN